MQIIKGVYSGSHNIPLNSNIPWWDDREQRGRQSRDNATNCAYSKHDEKLNWQNKAAS